MEVPGKIFLSRDLGNGKKGENKKSTLISFFVFFFFLLANEEQM